MLVCALELNFIFTSLWSLQCVTKNWTSKTSFVHVYVDDRSSERVSFLKVFHTGAHRDEQSKVKVV